MALIARCKQMKEFGGLKNWSDVHDRKILALEPRVIVSSRRGVCKPLVRCKTVRINWKLYWSIGFQ